MAAANSIKGSSSLLFASAAVLLVAACGNPSSSPSASSSDRGGVRAFDEWYKSFVTNRHYKTCLEEIARLDPSNDEQADWDAGERQLFVQIASDPRIDMDTAPEPFVPGLANCKVRPNYPAARDVWNLQDVLAPPRPDILACTKVARAYLASYNSLRVKRHPSAERELCSGR